MGERTPIGSSERYMPFFKDCATRLVAPRSALGTYVVSGVLVRSASRAIGIIRSSPTRTRYWRLRNRLFFRLRTLAWIPAGANNTPLAAVSAAAPEVASQLA